MTASVYKICSCRDQVKCRHPWWFSFKRRGVDAATGEAFERIRASLDVVLEKHIDSKTVAIEEANRLRVGIVENTLPARTRELLGLPVSAAPVLPTLTIADLLKVYEERHLAHTKSSTRQAYQIGAIKRTIIERPNGTTAPLCEWLLSDVTADTLERLREARSIKGVNTARQTGGSNIVGGRVAANRDLRLLRAAFNWALDKDLVERTPFKKRNDSAKTTVKLTRETDRSRRLQQGEGERLLTVCQPDLRAMVEAAIESGCRQGELLSMQWHQVGLDLRNPELWLPEGKTKSARGRRVPISKRLRIILEMRRDALRAALELQAEEPLPVSLHVFGNEIGQRRGSIDRAWETAVLKAHGHIPAWIRSKSSSRSASLTSECRAQLRAIDLHFHDLRREAGSRWMESSVPLATIQRWLGHTNIAQTSKYLAAATPGEHEAMRRFDEQIGRLTPLDTAGGTPPHEQIQSARDANGNTQQSTTKH